MCGESISDAIVLNQVGARVAKAAVAQGATAVLGKIFTIASTFFLARLLSPDDFGLQTIAFMVLGMGSMFSNFGFQTYIIQAKDLTQEKLETCYTLNMGLSIAMAVLVGGVGFVIPAPPYMLREILVLYGVMIFVSSLSYSHLALLKRDLLFRKSAEAELAFTVASSIGRVSFAYLGLGALCFPMGDVVGALLRWGVSRRAGGVDFRFRVPRGATAREVVGFGAYTTSVGLASFVANQIDKMLLTISQSVANIGYYGFASSMAAMFYNAFIVPQSAVFLSVFSRLQDNVAEVRKLLLRSSRFVFSLALPLNVLWVLEAELIVDTVFGAKWTEAAPLIRILAIDYFFRSMFSGFTGVQISFGLAKEAAKTKWMNSLVFVVFMFFAWFFELGIYGYAVMFAISSISVTAHNVHVNAKLIDFRMRPFFINLLPPMFIGLASTGVWFYAQKLTFAFSPVLRLLANGSSWVLVYILLTVVFNRIVINQLRGAVYRKERKS